MAKYVTTYDFIHICKNMEDDERINAIAGDTGIASGSFKTRRSDIEDILNFVKKIDEKYHDIVGYRDNKSIFFDKTLHDSISSDMRSLIILAVTNQNFQLNIVLRHLIETFVMTLWADLIANFQGSLNYFLKQKEWKEYRQTQRLTWEYIEKLPNNSIKERLERIRLLNDINLSPKKFPKSYFSKANSHDLKILFSLPICKKCINKKRDKINYKKSHLDQKARKKGKEDVHARFKTDFRLVCSFCNKQNVTSGFTMGIPETRDMLDMLTQIIESKLVINLRTLQKIYAYLSDNFVHFSTSMHPDVRPVRYNFGSKTGVLWGTKGVIFCLGILEPLMKYYFRKMRAVH